MSQRSRFMTVISHTISHSFVRNAQSPSLKRKLTALTKNQIDLFDNNTRVDSVGNRSASNESQTIKNARNLDQIIQASLWRMMQLSLYDPLSARRLLSASETGVGDVRVESDEIMEADMKFDPPPNSQP